MRAFLSLALAAGVLALVPTTTTAQQAGASTSTASTSAAAGVVHHQRYSTRDRMVTVKDGPGRTHETTIDTRLYRPKGATRNHPQPAILMTHGFGLTKDSAEVVNTARFLARHGYAVLTYTSQGFGASSGCVSLQSRTWDVKDAKQLITKVLARKRWVTHDRRGPVVGMVGGSYGGGIQANLAENDRRIRAIAPFRTWNTLQYSLDPNNYVAPGDPTGFTHTMNAQGVFKKGWTSLFFASGQSQSTDGGCPSDGAIGDQFPCGGFRSDVCQTFAHVSTTGDASDADRALLADSSATTQIDRWKVPTLLVQGQSDTLFNLNDAVASYTALRKRHVPVQMIWNSGGHGGYSSAPGECEPFDGNGTAKEFDHCYLPLRVLQFFDHYLKGTGPRGPAFSWFRDWKKYDGSGPTNVYGSTDHFPIGGRIYHLSGTDGLRVGGEVAGSTSIINPAGGQPAAYTETPNFSGPDSSPQNTTPPSDVPGQFASFTSKPLLHPLVSVGVPRLVVDLTHTAPTDLFIFAKVWDVAPNGDATLIHRLAAPARIPSDAPSSRVNIKLLGFAHRFAKGHSIRLTLCTTDQAYYNNPAPDVITISTGNPSAFIVPEF